MTGATVKPHSWITGGHCGEGWWLCQGQFWEAGLPKTQASAAENVHVPEVHSGHERYIHIVHIVTVCSSF